tara:strand:+ start:422 stop:538 length:117 start_codon:yes stop_codon:yes gene_type:complete
MIGLAKIIKGQNSGFENLGAKLYERVNLIASLNLGLSY